MIGTLNTLVLDAADLDGLTSFYTRLIGMTEVFKGSDWATLATPEGWRLAIQMAPDHQRPRWPDPAYPQQAHLDLVVRDIDDAAESAVSLGATRLDGGGETWRVLADPAGHPFCLWQGDEDGTKLYGITIDCPDPSSLCQFYAELVGMKVEYAGDEGTMLGADGSVHVMFQKATEFQPPRWPDPAHPQQFHLDSKVADLDSAESRVLALGATRLP